MDEIIGDDEGLVVFSKRWKKGAIFVEIFEIRSKMVSTSLIPSLILRFFFWYTWTILVTTDFAGLVEN